MKNKSSITLTPEARAAIDAPVNGDGGAQRLLRKLQEIFNGKDTAYLCQDMMGEISRMANNGSGGFQNRFKKIAQAISQ